MTGDYGMVSLGSVCDFQNGRAFKKTEWDTDGLPIIRIQNLNKISAPFNFFKGSYDKKIEVNSGDLLFSWSGTIGSSFGAYVWNREKGVLNQHIFKVSLSDEIDKKYAYHALQWITAEVEKQVNGAVGLVHITKTRLKEFEIPLPAMVEQKHIVAILDEAFAGIRQAVANTEKNLANARELFESYLNAVFTQDGEGWESVKLNDISIKITDGVHKKPHYVDNGVPFIKINNLTAGLGISFDGVSYISKEDHELFCKRTNPEKGDILITKDGTIGIVRVIDTDVEFSIFVSVALIKPIDKSISPYLKYVLESPHIQNQINPQGAALKHLYLRELREFLVPLPPKEVQERIVEQLDSLSVESYRLESTYQEKLNSLNELKQSLLQKAFSGALTTQAGKLKEEAAV